MRPAIEFVVKRDDLHVSKFVQGEPLREDLPAGLVQLRVEKFALTANNVTYAVYGDAIGYWGYFPASEQDWGRPPVWGFGEVVSSGNPEIEVGERFYGFFPISSLVTMEAKTHSAGFKDVAIHRQSLPKAYNQYTLTTRDPVYDMEHEDEQMILRPLFVTSFLAADFIQDKDLLGAEMIVISSASSKTAYGMAFLLSEAGAEVIGLTSPKNQGFTEGLGCYDQVLTYEDVVSLPAEKKVAYVDVAGSVPLRRQLAERLGARLVYSMALGDTHWNQDKDQELLTGDQTFFFAPDWLAKRIGDWGMEGYISRLAQAWRGFSPSLSGWMKVVNETGQDAVERVWKQHLDGKADPAVGNVLSLAISG